MAARAVATAMRVVGDKEGNGNGGKINSNNDKIATEQANSTEKMRATIKQLLDYCAMQNEAVLAYKATKTILAVHSDAGYCNKKKSRSRAGGHFFLSNDNEFPPNNCAILTVATIIKAVMSSVAEAELGALYLKSKDAVYLRQNSPRWATHNHKPLDGGGSN